MSNTKRIGQIGSGHYRSTSNGWIEVSDNKSYTVKSGLSCSMILLWGFTLIVVLAVSNEIFSLALF